MAMNALSAAVSMASARTLQRPNDTLILRLLDEIPVFCTWKRNSCAWTGPRGNLATHVASCPKSQLPCRFAPIGCPHVCNREQLAAHEAKCPAEAKRKEDEKQAQQKAEEEKVRQDRAARRATANQELKEASQRRELQAAHRREQAAQLELKQRAEQFATVSGQRITVNVRGQLMELSVSTLSKYRDSALAASVAQGDGFFLDFDPDAFLAIVNWLQT